MTKKRCLLAQSQTRPPSYSALPVVTVNKHLCFLCSTQGVIGVQGPVGYPGIRGVKVRHVGCTMTSRSCLTPLCVLLPRSFKAACAVFLRVTDKLFRCVTDRWQVEA